jgi:hypothetical protein
VIGGEAERNELADVDSDEGYGRDESRLTDNNVRYLNRRVFLMKRLETEERSEHARTHVRGCVDETEQDEGAFGTCAE